jgi:hypothetical protein
MFLFPFSRWKEFAERASERESVCVRERETFGVREEDAAPLQAPVLHPLHHLVLVHRQHVQVLGPGQRRSAIQVDGACQCKCSELHSPSICYLDSILVPGQGMSSQILLLHQSIRFDLQLECQAARASHGWTSNLSPWAKSQPVCLITALSPFDCGHSHGLS